MTTETKAQTEMDTIEALKAEAATLDVGRGSWRENNHRLIWCGRNDDGTFTFRNTTSPTRHGPPISEAEAAKLLESEGPWIRPERAITRMPA